MVQPFRRVVRVMVCCAVVLAPRAARAADEPERPAQKAPSPEDAALDRLVRQLSDDDWKVREKAQQDLGRFGYTHYGISPSGAADPLALRAANLLVGNAENAAALEMTLTGGEFAFDAVAIIALAGADFGASLSTWQPVEVRAGEIVRCPAARNGARCYLAVRGGFDVPQVMGSASVHVMTGVGGRPLRRGDMLAVGNSAVRKPRRPATGVPTRRAVECCERPSPRHHCLPQWRYCRSRASSSSLSTPSQAERWCDSWMAASTAWHESQATVVRQASASPMKEQSAVCLRPSCAKTRMCRYQAGCSLLQSGM